MRFRYKLEHMPCGLCDDITDDGCPRALCPYIMENLDDLFRDPAFREAVEDAEDCGSFHRPTLLLLKRLTDYESEAAAVPYIPPARNDVRASFKPECEGCRLPSHGFICFNSRDGSCLKTAYDNAARRKRAPCRE